MWVKQLPCLVKPKAVSALRLAVTDVERSLDFYKTLGFQEIPSDAPTREVRSNWFRIRLESRESARGSAGLRICPVVVVLIALMCYDALKRGGLLRWQPAAIALWIGLLIAGFWVALARLPAQAPGDLAAAALFVVLGTAGVMAILTPALLRARRRSRTDGGGR